MIRLFWMLVRFNRSDQHGHADAEEQGDRQFQAIMGMELQFGQ